MLKRSRAVIQFAKKTGDYSVLSTADMCVIALTYALEQKEKLEAQKAQAQVCKIVQAAYRTSLKYHVIGAV